MKRSALVGLLLVGCGTDGNDGPEILPDLTVPDEPANGLRVITPVVEDIQPGTDNEICTWTDAIVGQQTDVRSTLAYQVEPPGHHAILYYTLDKQPAGTQRVCTDTDMASFRFLAGNGGNGVLNEAPGNLVYRIPAGAQLVVNHHYLNSSDQVLRGQTAVAVTFAEPGNYIPSGNTAFLDTSIDVPTGVSKFTTSCTVDRELKLWYFAPHMHRWGTNIKVDVTTRGETMRMFDTTWDPSFTFHPPENRRDPGQPMILSAGDKVDVECNWNNDTGRSLGFGFEMCVAFGQFVDDTSMGNWACDGGRWVDF
ncbi:MAG: hypothetical protein KF773_03155 [Deltaproteobacteria bacterium]|nr:hypothetical protein [Deltaproteobacteria bacterium]MCW5804752.1 hypothetical protein [Deltaproteobacteria bacterium]